MRNLLIICTVLIAMFSTCASDEVTKSVVRVEVEQGNTLWEICEKHYSDKEDRSFEEFIHDASTRNNLRGRYLMVGEIVEIEKHEKK